MGNSDSVRGYGGFDKEVGSRDTGMIEMAAAETRQRLSTTTAVKVMGQWRTM